MNFSVETLTALLDPNNPYLFSVEFLFDLMKIMLLIGFGIYGIFAFVIVRQIQIMVRTVKTGLDTPLLLLGLIHLAFAFAVWLVALTTL